MTRVHIEAQMPDEEVADFLQRLRTWDAGRGTVRLAIKITETDLPLEDAEAIFQRLEPRLPFMKTLRWPEK